MRGRGGESEKGRERGREKKRERKKREKEKKRKWERERERDSEREREEGSTRARARAREREGILNDTLHWDKKLTLLQSALRAIIKQIIFNIIQPLRCFSCRVDTPSFFLPVSFNTAILISSRTI